MTKYTKAQTLKNILPLLKNSKVLPLLIFKVSDFFERKKTLVDEIRAYFGDKVDLLIVRSSSINEDSLTQSNAGKFLSIANISLNNDTDLLEAIQKVIDSYSTNNLDEEFFIQPMLNNIKLAGVVMTADLDTLAPYYIVNYEEGSSHDSVTSGDSDNLKTYIRFKKSPFDYKNKLMQKVINACSECESIFNNPYLDIEFAVDNNDQVFIFQVRPIVIHNKNIITNKNLPNALEKISKKIEKVNVPHPEVIGDRTIFGVMPDWNPAEIIGIKPKMLSLSLYKELVTDNIWAYQRDNYGYRNLRSYPLLISFIGVPYIDVRVSFNSFIPKNLNDNIAQKLCNIYIDKLLSKPKLHDKVEFEIVHSCYSLNISDKLLYLLDLGFNQSEIDQVKESLLELTNNIIDPQNGLYIKDLQKIEVLKERHEKIINSNLPDIDMIYWLIENCKRYGTLPFAGIARAAFIAVQFLKSFVDLKIITPIDFSKYLKTLNTVSKKLSNDLDSLFKKNITRDSFLLEYGHLRPGTYDILSKTYDEDFDKYFSSGFKYESSNHSEFEEEFSFTEHQLALIDKYLKINSIKTTSQELLDFIKASIEGREYSKFIFTKTLSYILKKLEKFGNKLEISRDDLAFLDINQIIKMYSHLDNNNVKDTLMQNIDQNKELFEYTKLIKLPSLITNSEDIYDFYLESEEPNFITLKEVEGEVVKEEAIEKETLTGKIVFIKSADPGYDFLFTKGIKGLVTQYGGVNSHMSIRCSELGIPAIIGAGERNYNHWLQYIAIYIDCSNKKVAKII